MAQLTVYLDEDTERTLRDSAKASGESASKWVADAIRQRAAVDWPDDISRIFGSWTDADIPDIEQLRRGLGEDIPREKL